jgi:2-C-methyl-D-erythritol 4-phosphate cytidylyltransferase
VLREENDPLKRVHALLLAGGEGNRFAAEIPKQFVLLAGRPVLARSLDAIAEAGVDTITVVAHGDWITETQAIVAAAQLSMPSTVTVGGQTRYDSARKGFAALAAFDAAADDVVVVHDAVRPLVTTELIARAIEPVLRGAAESADCVVASTDTMVQVDNDDVIAAPDRTQLRRSQTPQVFRFDILARAHEAAAAAGDVDATDDCGLVLRYVPGARVAAIRGDEANIKLTTPLDLAVAEQLLASRRTPAADQRSRRALSRSTPSLD